MTKLEQIEQAVLALTDAEKAKFRKWFAEFEAQRWDEQIERDAKAGKLEKLAERALAEYRAGRSREL